MEFVDETVTQKQRGKKYISAFPNAADMHTNDHGHSVAIQSLCLLAQDDSILQAFLEVGPDGGAGDVLDPDPQLLFLLRVVFLCNLCGQRGTKGHMRLMRSYVSQQLICLTVNAFIVIFLLLPDHADLPHTHTPLKSHSNYIKTHN